MSKIIRSIFILIIITFVSVSFVNAQTVEKEDSASWEVLTWDDNPEYPISYKYKLCTISVQKDYHGVTISVRDENWYGKTILQGIIIKQNEAGSITTKRLYDVVRDDGTFAKTEGYDIFHEKYLKATKNLPLKVKKAFLGYYIDSSDY